MTVAAPALLAISSPHAVLGLGLGLDRSASSNASRRW